MEPSRDLDGEIAKQVCGWSNVDWHFDRVEPMHMWLGGTPPGIDKRTGHIEEIPRYSSDGNAMLELLVYLSNKYDHVKLFSECGTWFCTIQDLVTFEIVAHTEIGRKTPMLALCDATLQLGNKNVPSDDEVDEDGWRMEE